MARFDMSDAEWVIIQLLLPNKPQVCRARMTSGCGTAPFMFCARFAVGPAEALRSLYQLYNRYNR